MNVAAAMRHAVYFAPSMRHPLWTAGCAWLGREPDGLSADAGPALSLRSSPWRYGFHATLKAPMALADGVHKADWLGAVHVVAQRHRRFEMPPLAVGMLADFIALRPAVSIDAAHPLRRLADDCVLSLDRWRASPSVAERTRYSGASFSDRQRNQAARLGYPHVLDDWRFHMSLSNSLAGIETDRVAALRSAAERHFAAALALPLACDSLCVFVEPAPGRPFELRHRLPLAA